MLFCVRWHNTEDRSPRSIPGRTSLISCPHSPSTHQSEAHLTERHNGRVPGQGQGPSQTLCDLGVSLVHHVGITVEIRQKTGGEGIS